MLLNDLPFASTQPDLPDLEGRLKPSACHHLRTWLRYLSCGRLIENEIRSRLRREFNTTLPRYEVMAQLEQFPQGIKMSDLSRHMMVTNGNLTGIADQLVKEGLVQRVQLPRDRRSALLKLTSKGQKHLQAMSNAHNEWVCSVFGKLSEAQIDAMMSSLEELKKHSQDFTQPSH